ncbi:MAG: DUF5916 domain-containing protein [Prolixibacteraceae bacterium]|nr:DUF5916 domain-containing protein [Prolixibacteraceae bacterium]
MKQCRHIILFQLLTGLFPFLCLAQSSEPLPAEEPYQVTKIFGDITFDGIPDEAAWESIEALPLIMYRPVLGGPPTEKSIIKIAYDDEYFYALARFFYQNPKQIRAIGKKRDYMSFSPDWFGFTIDSYYDKENAFIFGINPNGARIDGTVKNDLLIASDINFSWNTFWDAKTVMHEDGWTVETRVPLSSLRFQTVQGKTQMGLILMRSAAAKNETVTWPVISSDYIYPFWKPSLGTLLEFEGLEPKKPLYVTPYVTAGIGQVNQLNEQETGYEMHPSFKKDAGLDVKYSLTNNLTTDLTINTDFAQVEADDQVINLTRFSLYFPEKRVFFLEKEDVFDFSLLGNNNLFYSRRIGLYNGNPVRIYGGVRLTGKAGKWDLGFLDMQTEKLAEKPSENFGAIRTKRKVFNSWSYAGGLVTSRLGTDGSYNVAYGLDGLFRVAGDDYLTLKWAQTFEKNAETTVFGTDPSRFIFRWQRRKETRFAYDLIYSWSGKSFNPGIGFEVKQNYQGPEGTVQYGWLPGNEYFLRHHKISFSGNTWMNTITGDHETTNAAFQWNFSAKKGYTGFIGSTWSLEFLTEDLILGNHQATVPAGEYSFINYSAQYETSSAKDLSALFYTNTGNFYDGWKWTFYASPYLKIGTDFDFGLFYRIDMVKFAERSMEFTNHIVRLNGLMTLTTKTSLSAFVQYNTAIDGVIGNIRFRYNPRDGNDFYLVYDERLNTIRKGETPALPFTGSRTVLLKYTYTFRW